MITTKKILIKKQINATKDEVFVEARSISAIFVDTDDVLAK